MAETIKGINVVIGAETTGLSKALSDVNRKSKDIQSELKQVEKLLKLDPTNTELLAQKQKLLSDSVSNTTEKLNRLKLAQEQVNQQFASGDITEGQYRAFQRELAKTEAELKKMDGQLDETTKSLNEQGVSVSKLGKDYQESFDQAKQSMGNSFDKMKAVGAGVTAMGATIAAGLGVAVKGAADFEQGMANVYSVMAPEEVAQFKDELKDLAVTMGADTKYSATEASQGIEELIKAGLSAEQVLKGGLSGALSLATAGDLELADAAEIASTALNAFKDDALSVQQAADILAGAANASATSVMEMKFGLSQVAAVASSVGLSFKDTSTALALFAQNGLKGSDAGTSLKTMLMRLTPTTNDAEALFEDLGLMTFKTGKALQFLAEHGVKPASESVEDVTKALQKYAAESVNAKEGSKKANKAFDDLSFSIGAVSSAFYDNNGNLKDMAQISDILQKSLKGMTAEQRQVALNTMFGSDAIRGANILFKEGAKGINDMSAAMGKVKAQDVANQKLNTFKGTIEQLSGSLETAKIALGDALLPALRKIAEVVQKAVDVFNGLPKELKSFIAIAGAAGASIGLITGPMLLLIGFIPQIVAGFTMLAPVLTAVTGPIGLIAAGIAGLVAGGVLLYNHLKKDAIPEIERFGDEVSESTQKSVGSFMDLNDKATVALNELSWSGKTVTQEMSNSIVSTFQKMGDQILTSIDSKQAEQISVLQGFFANAKTITEAEQNEILNKVRQSQEQQKTSVTEAQNQIKAILEKASAEKRALTSTEADEINRIQQKMLETGIEVLSDSETEQKAIMERMKANAEDLSARQAAEVVANSTKQRDEVVKNAEDQYNNVVKQIIRQRDEMGTISAEQASKLIAEAQRQRDEVVKRAEDMHSKTVEQAKLQAGEHVDEVDWTTGEILKLWQIYWNKLQGWQDKIDNFIINSWNKIKDSVSGIVTKLWEWIKAEWDKMIVWFTTLPEKMKQIGIDIIQGLLNGLDSMKNSVVNKAKEIANGIGDSVKDFFGIHSPSRLMMGYGENIGQGLAIGIADAGKQAIKSATIVSNAVANAMELDYSGVSMAANAALQGTTTSSAVPNQTNVSFADMFRGANFTVRNDDDIKSIAQQLGGVVTQNIRALGGA